MLNQIWKIESLPDRVGEVVTQKTDLTRDLEKKELLAVIETLRFPSMDDREQAIPDAYKSTFSWLLASDAANQHQKWDNFPSWLREDTKDIYRITGKPGSGKSTLTKISGSES